MSNTYPDNSELHAWLSDSLGESLLKEQQRRIVPLLSGLYGPIAVQVGNPGFYRLLESSSAIHHLVAVDQVRTAGRYNQVALCSAPESMPFEARSVSVLLLPHVLEFNPDPHLVLREASRVLVPDGHLVLTGFNPYSFWGIRRKLGACFRNERAAPWQGRFFSLTRVKDWVSVLGFEAVAGSWAYHLPPVKSPTIRESLAFLQKAGERWWPMFAATFILVVKKREFGMTPITPGWKKRKRLSPGIAEPVVRNG